MDDNTIKELVARRLKELRVERGYPKAADFAKRIGVDGPRLSRMESGQQGISTLVLRRAAHVLGVRMDDFFREPAPPVTMMRSGGADDAKAEEMAQWARALRSDLDMVAEYRHGLRA